VPLASLQTTIGQLLDANRDKIARQIAETILTAVVDGLTIEDDAERRAAALRKIVEGVRALNGHASDVGVTVAEEATVRVGSRDAKPRGRGAVRLIVAERPGVWSLAELREEMKRRGWFTSPKGLEVAVTRLCDAGEARRVAKGRYEFPAATTEGDDSP
jgi:hypothetical protein